MADLAPMPYDEWVEFCFTRGYHEWSSYPGPVDCQRALALPGATVADYLVRLMENSAGLATRYKPWQIANGIWFIFGIGSSYFEGARSPDVPPDLRHRVYDAIPRIYLDLFDAACCPPRPATWDVFSGDPVDRAVFMIWDMDIVEGPFYREGPDAELREDAFKALETILTECRHPACIQSALHGLGHACDRYPDRVTAIIDGFLERRGADMPAAVRAYAGQARTGYVQ